MKTLLAFLACLIAGPVLAQTWGPSGPQTPHYQRVVFPYVYGRVGDGSNAQGGTPPAFASEPADIPTGVSPAGWIISDGSVVAPPTDAAHPEAKFRTQCDMSHVAADDPIRNFNAPGTSHLHQFFGNTGTNYASTYSSLRTTGGSTCGGGPFNHTGYWFPCFLKQNALGDGITRCIKADFAIVYYNEVATKVARLQRIPRGLRYVTGTNMDDPDDVAVKGEVATANTESVAAGGFPSYEYLDNGWGGYICIDTGVSSKWLANSDGSDALGNCPSTSKISASILAPQCWDGVNLSSIGGYKHMRHAIRDSNSGLFDICPIGWYYLPTLEVKLEFTHGGPSDYTQWRLSSDDMAATKAGHPMRNGESFHADWFGGWDYGSEASPGVMLQWQNHCNGVAMAGHPSDPHQCDYSTINTTQRLITNQATPDGSRTPVQCCLGTARSLTDPTGFFDIPAPISTVIYNGGEGFNTHTNFHRVQH
jgi:hypothetical protein